MKPKNFLYLFVSISLFIAIYLYFVGVERSNSIKRYFNDPQVGDIYKIKSDEEDGERWLRYYKVAEVQSNHLVFYKSKMMADASVDYLLNHYDTLNPVIYSRNELAGIKEGKWKNNQRNNTELIEIVRRH